LNNPYDFVRVNNVTIASFVRQDQIHSDYERNLGELKDTIRADLKLAGLNRDVLALIRAIFSEKGLETEKLVLGLYRKWIANLLTEYSTSLEHDQRLLQHVMLSQDYHWIYKFILIYRIG
jgi:hypothetical protein